MGKANPGYEVTIVEPGTDRPLPPETPGEIVVDMKIPNIVMRAYYGMPEKTAEDFRNLKLHTGDLGRMDADGYFYFMDRVKDYIRRRGENVSSMEVERQVVRPPERHEAAAIGVKAGEGASSEDEIMIVCIAEGDRARPGRAHPLAGRADALLHGAALHPLRGARCPRRPTERVQKVKLRDEGITRRHVRSRGRRHHDQALAGVAEILRYGAYLPRHRAPLKEIQNFFGRPGRPRAKALATPALDEDALTMAYEAAVSAVDGADAPGTVITVSQAPPFGLRKLSGTLARALGLRRGHPARRRRRTRRADGRAGAGGRDRRQGGSRPGAGGRHRITW